jgi:hypothetical protein
MRSSLEPPPYRLTMRGQVFGLGQRDDVSGDVFEGCLGVVDDMDTAQEGLHRQAAGMPGAARGRQDVVRSSAVVAEAYRRPRADENGPGRTYLAGNPCRVGGLDLQVFSGVRVDDLDAGVQIVDQNDRRLSSTQRGRHPFAVHRGLQLGRQFGVDAVGQGQAWSHQHAAGHLVVFGLADQVGGHMRRIGGVVGEDGDLGRPGFGVDTHP